MRSFGKNHVMNESAQVNGWQEYLLGDIFELASGAPKPRVNSVSPSEECTVPVYGGNGVMCFTSEEMFFDDHIIIGRVGEKCGCVHVACGPHWITDNALYTRSWKRQSSIPYFGYLLQYLDLSRTRAKGGQPLVTQKPIYAIRIHLPPLPEQKAIAAILSTWDRAIEQVTKLIEAKTRLKKGLMQQLLTGKKRFKEFKGKKWHTLKFSDFVSQSKDLHDPRKESTSFRCLELEHLSSGDGRLLGETESHVQLSIKRKFVEGDILFGKLRPYLRKYWTATFAGVCSTEIWVLRANRQYCIPEFLYSVVQTPEFEAGANKSFGSKMPRSDWNVVSDLQFQLPDIAEQERISETMKLLDRNPEHLIALRDMMITQKQALMQVLLTGKVRVKTDDKAKSKGGKR